MAIVVVLYLDNIKYVDIKVTTCVNQKNKAKPSLYQNIKSS